MLFILIRQFKDIRETADIIFEEGGQKQILKERILDCSTASPAELRGITMVINWILENVQEAFTALVEAAENMNLRINEKKLNI